jgi:hypothetical protein
MQDFHLYLPNKYPLRRKHITVGGSVRCLSATPAIKARSDISSWGVINEIYTTAFVNASTVVANKVNHPMLDILLATWRVYWQFSVFKTTVEAVFKSGAYGYGNDFPPHRHRSLRYRE